MVKRELQTGMMVRLRNYTAYYVVMLNVSFSEFRHQDLLVSDGGWMPLGRYNDDMTYPRDDDFDIIEVWRPTQQSSLRVPCGTHAMEFKDYFTQIWVREDEEKKQEVPVVEMTLKEIEQALGRKIKVVSDESEKSVVSSEVPSTNV